MLHCVTTFQFKTFDWAVKCGGVLAKNCEIICGEKTCRLKYTLQNEVNGSVILKQSGKIDENTVRVEYVLKIQIN